MKVRADIGMVFQEGALFDSLTVAENVGYKLYEETDQPLDAVRKRVEEVLGFVRLSQFIDRQALGAVRRPAAARRHRARHDGEARHPAVRRADDRASIRLRRRRSTKRSSSCATSKR